MACRFSLKLLVVALVLLVCFAPRPARAAGETLQLIVPEALPSETGAGAFTPSIEVRGLGLGPQIYTVEIYLLEDVTGNHWLASTGFWSPYRIVIDNRAGNDTVDVCVARSTDVYGYTAFLWVAELRDEKGLKVAYAEQPSVGSTLRAPVLNPIGDKSGTAGQPMTFSISASAPGGLTVRYRARNLPPGARLDPQTGQFQWASAIGGTYANVVFEAVLVASELVSDAEVITIRVAGNGGGDPRAWVGEWSRVFPAPVVPIHAVLLSTGSELLVWDRHHEEFKWDGTPRLLDLGTGLFSTVASPGWDIFCAGHTQLPDGRVFVAGGHREDFVGEDRAAIFNPRDKTWEELPRMPGGGRWYPTCTLLPDGSVAVFAGTTAENVVNPIPIVWDATRRVWLQLSQAAWGAFPGWPFFYPFTMLMPNGTGIFMAGPQQQSRLLTLPAGVFVDGPQSGFSFLRDYGSFFQFEAGMGLVAGGGNPPAFVSTASAEILDLTGTAPRWVPTRPMTWPRRHHCLVPLPDGTLLAVGGSRGPGKDNSGGMVLHPEIWSPQTGDWALMGPAARPRLYHSFGLLLPDGRVLVGGGGHPDPAGGAAQMNYEYFSPPYLFAGQRPVISAVAGVLGYGGTFSLETASASTIANVRLIRLASVTHAYDMNQAVLSLLFTRESGGLRVTAPTNPNTCPRGYYMLFIVDAAGVPSVAKIVQVQ